MRAVRNALLIRLSVIASVKICSNMLVCLFTSGDVRWNGELRFVTVPLRPIDTKETFGVWSLSLFKGGVLNCWVCCKKLQGTVLVFGGYLGFRIPTLTASRDLMHLAEECFPLVILHSLPWVNKNIIWVKEKKTQQQRLEIMLRKGTLSLLFMEKCELFAYILQNINEEEKALY